MCKIFTITVALSLMLCAEEWQSLNGPPVGRADDLSIGQHAGQHIIYAADQTHMLYKSTNEGEYWDSLTYLEVTKNPICVITEPNEAWTVYIGKTDAIPVWKSTNSGETWEQKSTGITNSNPLCFAMDPDNSNIVYLGCDTDACAMFKTISGGADWQTKDILPGSNDPAVNEIAIITDPPQNTKILAGCTGTADQRGVWCSTDGGDSWSQILSNVNIYSVKFASADIIYAGSDLGVYKSTDGGLYWAYLPNSPPYRINDIEAITATVAYAATNASGMFKTTDGGTRWNAMNTGIYIFHGQVITVHPGNNQILYFGAVVAIYRTSDAGQTWTEKTKGMRNASAKGVSTKLPDAIYVLGVVSTVHKSTDQGLSWMTIDDGLPYSDRYYIAADPTNSLRVFHVGEKALDMNYVKRTTNGG